MPHSRRAATITVNSLLDDVYVNATGSTFSDAAYTTPVSPAYCTRMALAAANLTLHCWWVRCGQRHRYDQHYADWHHPGVAGCNGAGGCFQRYQTWLLYSTGNVTVNGPAIN